MKYPDITEKIIGACFEVANELGAGYLESVYQKALAIVLRQKGMSVLEQYPLTVYFRNQSVGDFFADLIVEGKVIVELKAVKALAPEHQAQVISYLKTTGRPVGLLVNFGSPKVEIKRLFKPENLQDE